ncbi:hypothetical protein SAMN04487949_2850 [Halogranum gelatinilyticum]|uniref:Uncharacterized protein n=1 Tax=Halogranum gelatinilyticum TaxID=660521 RepID=A0A1G9X6T9_9EURY|nr:hypothetical protein SAMN04487949_2850 [Halogranum gelatinilyticum]
MGPIKESVQVFLDLRQKGLKPPESTLYYLGPVEWILELHILKHLIEAVPYL